MPSWSRFGERRSKASSTILPVSSSGLDESEEHKYHGKPSALSRRNSATRSPRLVQWLWAFLLLNLVAVLGFIFSSALYFPSVTHSVVHQALQQSIASPQPRQQEKVVDGPGAAMTPFSAEPSSNPPTTSYRITEQANGQLLPEEGEQRDLMFSNDPKLKEDVSSLSPQADVEDNGEDATLPSEKIQTLAPIYEISQEPKSVEKVQTPNPTSAQTAQESTTADNRQALDEVMDRIAKMKGKSTLRSNLAAIPPTETLDSPSIPQNTAIEIKVPKAANAAKDANTAKPNARLAEIKRMQKKTIEGEEQLHAALRPNLLAWLKADKGVEVESLQECIATGSGSSCNVKSWRSQVGSESSQYKFTPASRDQLLPLFLPSISDRNKLPALYFACPMQNEALRLHDYMTLFFVLSPAQIEAGNSYKGQKFFGNSPYGQFFFHGGKPGFLSGGGVRELDTVASSGNFYLLTYRLHRNSVEIKMNGQSWGPRITSDTNGNNNDAAFAVRMSDNAALSLGNVKPICDTNAFQGRIAEVMVYDTILTDTQVRDVETYLQQKWWDAPFDISDTGATPDGDITEVPADTREDTAAAEANDAIKNEQTALDSTSTAAVKDTNLIEIHDDNEPQDEDDLEAATQPPLQSEETKESMSPPEPVTFDPEYVFDWTPSQELLAAKAEKAATLGVDLTVEWAKAVKERVDAIRGFQFGGDVLRAYIRSRKEELLALRQELFG